MLGQTHVWLKPCHYDKKDSLDTCIRTQKNLNDLHTSIYAKSTGIKPLNRQRKNSEQPDIRSDCRKRAMFRIVPAPEILLTLQ